MIFWLERKKESDLCATCHKFIVFPVVISKIDINNDLKRCQIEEVADGERIVYFYIQILLTSFRDTYIYYIGHLFII